MGGVVSGIVGELGVRRVGGGGVSVELDDGMTTSSILFGISIFRPRMSKDSVCSCASAGVAIESVKRSMP
jgi:hypothetical protein